MKQYTESDVLKLGEHYTNHLKTIMSEDPTSYQIAAELAWRDIRIAELEKFQSEIRHSVDVFIGPYEDTVLEVHDALNAAKNYKALSNELSDLYYNSLSYRIPSFLKNWRLYWKLYFRIQFFRIKNIFLAKKK